MDLKDWTISYIEYLNVYKRTLKSKTIKNNIIECVYSDKGEINYIICEKLEECEFDNKSILVCLNTKQNLNALIEKWPEFIKFEKLKIIFVNPDVNLQWSLIPYLHHKYNDEATLKIGLKTLFDSIPSI